MKNEYKDEDMNGVFRKCTTIEEVFGELFLRYENIHSSVRNRVSHIKMARAFTKAIERSNEILKNDGAK